MEHLPPEGLQCDKCAAGFKDVDELARHKHSHDADIAEHEASRSDNPGAGNRRLRGSHNDNQRATTADVADGSNEEARAERAVVEGQRNDRTNDLANRASTADYRDNDWKVNPDQPPKREKTIRPIPHI